MKMKQSNIVKWKLHDRIGVPHTDKLSVQWLRALRKATPGKTVINPTMIGKRQYTLPTKHEDFVKFKREVIQVFNFLGLKD